ncbi:flagellar basal body-associated FliL family protein [Paenirhodobacter sp.]|uniref:flagellar basal body-associated FliL family protein n=1 Tax=Paenirhodobacter sp. TaxID=1965326 RepID=UPI003B3FF3D2
MRKILPILLALIGIAAGGGAGYFLRPPPTPAAPEPACAEEPCENRVEESKGEGGHAASPDTGPTDQKTEFAKLNNQFIVPDIRNGAISSLVVLSLSLEVTQGSTEKVFSLEPKLRDSILRVLFDHANAGGFRGDFTSSAKMEDLRRSLLEAARSIMGADVRGILISDIVRQDMS